MKITLAGVVHIGDLEDLEVLRESLILDPDGRADPLTRALLALDPRDQRAALLLLGLLAHEASAWPGGVTLPWLAERALQVQAQLGAAAAPLARLVEALLLQQLGVVAPPSAAEA